MPKSKLIKNETEAFSFHCKANEMADAVLNVCKVCKPRSVTLQFSDNTCRVQNSSGESTVEGTLEGSGFLQLKRREFNKLMATYKSNTDDMTITNSSISTGSSTIGLDFFEFIK